MFRWIGEILKKDYEKDPFGTLFAHGLTVLSLIGLLLFGVGKCINKVSPPPAPESSIQQPANAKP